MNVGLNKILRILFAGLLVFMLQLPATFYAQAEEEAAADSQEDKPNGSTGAMTADEFLSTNAVDKNKYSTKMKGYHCYKAQDKADGGKVEDRWYCIELVNGKEDRSEVVSALKENWGGRGCPIVSVKWHNNQGCKFCSFLKTAFLAADHVSFVAKAKFANSFANLIVIVFVIWLAIRTLNHAAFLTPQDAAKYITDIIIQAFKFLLAYFALKYYDEVFHFLIEPIFISGLDFADKFVDTGIPPGNYADIGQPELFNPKIYQRMEEFSYNVNYNFSLLQTVGSVLNCLAGKFFGKFLIRDGYINLGLGFTCFVNGLFFSIIGFLLSLAFVFYLFDAVVEYGIFGALVPFALACWPFKMFTKSANNALKLFLNSMFTFMMAGVAVKICVSLISNAVASNTEGGGMSGLIQAMDTLDIGKLHKLVTVISLDFLIFAFAGLSGFLLVGKIPTLTNAFAGGGISPTASKIATMGASAVKGTAKKVAAPVEKAVGAKIRNVGHNIVHNNPIAKGVRKIKANIKEKMNGNKNAQEINIGGGAKPNAGGGNTGGKNNSGNDSGPINVG